MSIDVTLLIFSRNDTQNAQELIQQQISFASEVVVIDSSDKDEHARFRDWASKLGTTPIKIYYCVPLGYPDMLRPYAFSKCTNDWVFMLDTDERASFTLNRNLGKIIESNQAEVYAVMRYSGNKKGEKLSETRSPQVRIFKKDFLDEKGIMHIPPSSKGRLATLPDEYFILHLLGDKVDRTSEYDKVDQFKRISYGDISQRIRLLFVLTHLGRIPSLGSELYDLDYMIFYFLKAIYSAIVIREPMRIFRAFWISTSRTKRMSQMKKQNTSKVDFEISKIVNRIGVVKFLELDIPENVEKINMTYKDDPDAGSDLLAKLLRKRYAEYVNEEKLLSPPATASAGKGSL